MPAIVQKKKLFFSFFLKESLVRIWKELGNNPHFLMEICKEKKPKNLILMLVTIQSLCAQQKMVVKNIPCINIHLHIKFLSP